MKNIFLFIVTFTALSCGNITQKKSTISQEDFAVEYQKGINQLLDVRTKQEYNQGFIPGSILIDIYNDNFIQQASKLDKNKPVYVYCKSGGRGKKATELLLQNGFKKVYNLEGGYSAWKTKQNK